MDISENDSEVSPPSYCVVEAHDGTLYSPALNVTWPNRPLNGRYSKKYKEEQNRKSKVIRAKNRQSEKKRKVKDFDEELEMDSDAMTEIQERMKFAKKNDDKFKDWMTFNELEKEMKKEKVVPERKSSENGEKSASEDSETESFSELTSSNPDSSRETDITLPQIPKSDPNLTSHFVGIQKPEKVIKHLRPTHFVLYYKKNDIYTIADIPLELPLMLAYMSNKGKVYHCPLLKERRSDGKKIWQVQFNSEGLDDTQPCFLSLSALVSFHESFYCMNKNGEVELMPTMD
uniref:Uncharacterized protein n=1 Tax=Panagrolaimus sp. JU765 TaxID=591449 RepID=A0AC34RLC6_9BILA